MDNQATDTVASDDRFSRGLAARLMQKLAAATPAEADPAESRALFEAMAPGDPADAMLATLAIAAAQSAIDSFARAARPDVRDEAAIRLRGGALAATRVFAMALRTLRKQRQPAAEPRPVAPARAMRARQPSAGPAQEPQSVPAGFIALQPGATPIPAVELFQPRDRFGMPIPNWRTDLMTRAQCRAALAYPRDPALEAAALAEEEAMIAEQKALEAADVKPPPPPDPLPRGEGGQAPVSPPGGR